MTAQEAVKYLQEKCCVVEPVFILRGQDILAPSVVLLWAQQAEICGVGEEKICSAVKVSVEMKKWAGSRLPD